MSAVSQGSSPVARALARATTAAHVERLMAHPDVALSGWQIAYDDDVTVRVAMTATCSAAADSELYHVSLDCDSYDAWPPEVKFINPLTGTYAVHSDRTHLPNIQGFPNFALHPTYSNFYTPGRVDQLVCFSFGRGYYDSAHQPTLRERWTPGRHWLYTTIRVLHRALQPPYYVGRLA